jgi:hypothetical protein
VTQNPILAEIRHTRDELARKSGYDVRKMMNFIREREREAKARGVRYVSAAQRQDAEAQSSVVREEPTES